MFLKLIHLPIFLVSVFLLMIVHVSTTYAGVDSFITTWDTTNAGASAADTVTIPTYGTGYNFTIEWGDGATSTYSGSPGDISHTYATTGVKIISIDGTFPRMKFKTTGAVDDSNKITSVDQWGNIAWDSAQAMFARTTSLNSMTATAPDFSNVTDMSQMFYSATNFDSDISSWDVSNITNMLSTFSRAATFNQPLNSWDVSSTTNMSGMFQLATSFNQPLDLWDVSSVTNMSNLFLGADSFNKPIDSWDVSSVTNMQFMLAADSFNQPINSWDVSSVVNMYGIFRENPSFNKPMNSWNPSSLTSMEELFVDATSFNQPLDSWDVSNVTGMDNTFTNATSFNRPLSSWDVSSVTSMYGIFNGATSFDKNLAEWDVRALANFTSGFNNTNISIENYSNTLVGWAEKTPIANGLSMNTVPSSYYTYASSSRAALVSSGWTINDDGSVLGYTAIYVAGPHASLIGKGAQGVASGADASAVEVVPDDGYTFDGWSDGSSENPRQDTALTGNISVSAVINEKSRRSSGGVHIRRRAEHFENEGLDDRAQSIRAQYPEFFTDASSTPVRVVAHSIPEKTKEIALELLELMKELLELLAQSLESFQEKH